MAFTYLDSQMIEIPASIAELSANSLYANNFTVNNIQSDNIQTPTFGNAALWYLAYFITVTRNQSWDSTFNIVSALSANWNSSYSSVCSLSSDWSLAYNIVQALSANWNTSYNAITSSSNNWDATYATITALSANWESSYVTVNTLSTQWEESADIIPTVTDYLSTNNIQLKDVTFPQVGGSVYNDAKIFGDVIIYGALSALSGAQIFQSVITTVASSLSVENFGPGPALYVFQDSCLESIAVIKGADNTNVFTVNNTLPNQEQDGVKIYFTGTGNTFAVGNPSNNTALVVTSAGNINTSGEFLSGNIPLHNIFLTSETDSQTLTYTESSYDLEISNGNIVNLSSINTTVQTNSANWESVYNTVNTISGYWDSTYSTVCALSAAWEESADIIPTVTDYFFTNVVAACSLNVIGPLLSANFNLNSLFVQQGPYNTSSVLWNSTFVTVSSLSASWEESADIIPTITNYLSTNLIAVSTINVTEQLLSANIDLNNIFAANTIYTGNSANWDSTYVTVCSLSASWEETADILPLVTNYLSTSNVVISSLSAIDAISTTNLIVLSTEQVPALSTDFGIKGSFKWDLNYFYVCVEPNTWKRVALSGWEG